MTQVQGDWILLRQLLAIYQPRTEHLEALITECAVRRGLEAEGHQTADFSMWAVRRVARRKDRFYAQIFQPKDWAWMVFSPLALQDLSEANQQALAHFVRALHGVVYIHWGIESGELRFRTTTLKAVEVGRNLNLVPGAWANKSAQPLPDWTAHFDPGQWPGVSPAHLLSAVVESYYVEQRAAASKGAFTNLDVVVVDQPKPVIIEVKRRTQREDVTSVDLSLTQYDTLQYLRERGFETHLITRHVPPSARNSREWLEQGEWQAHSPRATFEHDAMYQMIGELPAPTLTALRDARNQHVPGLVIHDDPILKIPLIRQEEARQHKRKVRTERHRERQQLRKTTGLTPLRQITRFSTPYDFLDPWTPAEIKMRGLVYRSAALAFLAARTEDNDLRLRLAQATTRSVALRLARQAPERRDWLAQCPEMARGILRMAYQGERRRKLVDTLPFLLADGELFDPLLTGLQGQPGLQALMALRGEFAIQQARNSEAPCCEHCLFARPSRQPGFLRFGHPHGVQVTLECSRQRAFEDPANTSVALVAMTNPAGVHFKSR